MLLRAYSLAASEFTPPVLASQKTLANLLPTEVCALVKSILFCNAKVLIGAVRMNKDNKSDNSLKSKLQKIYIPKLAKINTQFRIFKKIKLFSHKKNIIFF